MIGIILEPGLDQLNFLSLVGDPAIKPGILKTLQYFSNPGALGIPEGPLIREILERLQNARLDGRVASQREEIELVKSWL